jgi:hypothetical protein
VFTSHTHRCFGSEGSVGKAKNANTNGKAKSAETMAKSMLRESNAKSRKQHGEKVYPCYSTPDAGRVLDVHTQLESPTHLHGELLEELCTVSTGQEVDAKMEIEVTADEKTLMREELKSLASTNENTNISLYARAYRCGEQFTSIAMKNTNIGASFVIVAKKGEVSSLETASVQVKVYAEVDDKMYAFVIPFKRLGEQANVFEYESKERGEWIHFAQILGTFARIPLHLTTQAQHPMDIGDWEVSKQSGFLVAATSMDLYVG